jgi:low affinity Fe/Cu permease
MQQVERERKLMRELFRKFARKISEVLGRAEVFLGAVVLIVVWAVLGPIYHYSDTWQLVINTATTIVTFLMVFLIQNTQNRDAKAIQLKLDELLRGVQGARTGLVRLEELSDEELKELESSFERLRSREAPTGTAGES